MLIVFKAMPLLLGIYFYLIPKVLISSYVDNFIHNQFRRYIKDQSDFDYIKGNINKIVTFISFISAYGGIIIAVLCDQSFKWQPPFIICGIIFLLVGLYLFIQYTTNDLELTKGRNTLEVGFFILAVLVTIANGLRL